MRQLAAALAATTVFAPLITAIPMAARITITMSLARIGTSITQGTAIGMIGMVTLVGTSDTIVVVMDIVMVRMSISTSLGWTATLSMKIGMYSICDADVIFVGWEMIVRVTIVCFLHLLLVLSLPLFLLFVAQVASAVTNGRGHHQWHRTSKCLCSKHQ